MIHRAILGSLERFIGILTEEFAGFFPSWLAPVQVVVMNITDSQAEYVNELTRKLQNAGIRVKADLRNEKIGFKIREHTLRRVPYMLVCGDKEVEAGKVAVRTRRGKDLGSLDVNEVIEKLQQEAGTNGGENRGGRAGDVDIVVHRGHEIGGQVRKYILQFIKHQ